MPPNTRFWQCVHDPTARDDDASQGDFIGGCFHLRDLQASRDEHTWPDGIMFRHTQTGKLLKYLNGKLVETA